MAKGTSLRSLSRRPTTPATKDQIGLGRPAAAEHFGSSTARGPKGVMPITPGPGAKLPGAPSGQDPSRPQLTGGTTVAQGPTAQRTHAITSLPGRPAPVANRRTDGPPSPAHGPMAKGNR
jgi:hypothetical protein